jgi:hypothetical protein
MPDTETLASLREASRRSAIRRMLDNGGSYGEAVGGALSFLSEPNALEFIHEINNELSAHTNIVSNSFNEYVNGGEIPAPHYAWRICIILRRRKMVDLERSFLSAWCKHFVVIGIGARYEHLVKRAIKIGAYNPSASYNLKFVLKVKVKDYHSTDVSGRYHLNFEFHCDDCGGYMLKMPDTEYEQATCTDCGISFGTAEDVRERCREVARLFMAENGL